MKDNNFYNIRGWMINQLNLSGTPLLVYALLHSFHQRPSDNNRFNADNVKYIAESTGAKEEMVRKALDFLVHMDYLHEAVVTNKDGKEKRYYVINREEK